MRDSGSDVAYVWDMLHAAEGLSLSIAGLELQHYLASEDLRMSVERRVEIIGEAARRISDEFKKAHPGIPWKGIISQRHVIAHDYDEIDDRLIWRLVTDQVPDLIQMLKKLLPPAPDTSYYEDDG